MDTDNDAVVSEEYVAILQSQDGLRTITINYSRDSLLNDFAIETLKDRYMVKDEASPQEALGRAALAYADSSDHAQRLYDYASKQWFSFSTPILANGGTGRGLPISCFLNYVGDSIEGITEHYKENGYLSTRGGGIGSYWGDLRSRGTKTSKGNETPGVISFMHVEDSQMLAFYQGSTRRGASAAYLDISHPEIEDFIRMRKPSGGDIHRKCLNLHHGVNITNEFMEAVRDGADFELVDPVTGKCVRTVSARGLWQEILSTRVATGEPYLHFIDASNAAIPDALRRRGLQIRQSNLCSEIILPTSEDRTAVCCLSSVNLEKYDEWKDNEKFVDDLVRMLDNVLSYFISNAPSSMWRAVNSAKRERSIGLGAMGFHSYLQSKGIPFEGLQAYLQNKMIFKHIKEKAIEVSKRLAKERGEPTDMEGTGLRFAHLLAIAPNASSSIVGCTSPSIEPWRANIFKHDTLSGTFIVRNPFLKKRLKELGMDTKDVWMSIMEHDGSVQHLEFLSSEDKEVFKTALEIDQEWIIKHASERQQFICQAQSVNIFVPSDVHWQKLHNIHMNAWKGGMKTLYYCRSMSAHQAEKVTESKTNLLDNEVNEEYVVNEESTCIMCEG